MNFRMFAILTSGHEGYSVENRGYQQNTNTNTLLTYVGGTQQKIYSTNTPRGMPTPKKTY